MNHRSIVSSTGEDVACGYLENNYYSILDRNYRTRFGEIDIIAISPDKTLVFCEVKTIQQKPLSSFECRHSFPQHLNESVDKLGKVRQCPLPNPSLSPEDNMSPTKIHRCFRIGEWYANNHPKISSAGWRIDLVAIVLDSQLSVVSLRHYQNITTS